MRTNIDIDDALVAQAQKVSGYATKTQTVEQALRLMIKRSDSARSTPPLTNIVGAATRRAVAKGAEGPRQRDPLVSPRHPRLIALTAEKRDQFASIYFAVGI